MECSLEVQQLLEDLDLFKLPVVPKDVCRQLDVEYREYQYEGIEGTLIVLGSRQIIGVNAHNKETSRKAFSCAHELGHYYYDLADGTSSFACSPEDITNINPNNPRELRANQFAAELLMPRKLFEPLIQDEQPSWDLITKLANHCGTSIQATTQRYVELTPHHCWFAILREGKVWRYQKQARSPYHLSTKELPVSWKNIYPGWREVPANIWMGRGRHTRGRKLSQAYLPENSYGETLVLLWDRHGNFERLSESVQPRASWWWLLYAIMSILALIFILKDCRII